MTNLLEDQASEWAWRLYLHQLQQMGTPRLHGHHSACEEVPEKISAQKTWLEWFVEIMNKYMW